MCKSINHSRKQDLRLWGGRLSKMIIFEKFLRLGKGTPLKVTPGSSHEIELFGNRYSDGLLGKKLIQPSLCKTIEERSIFFFNCFKMF